MSESTAGEGWSGSTGPEPSGRLAGAWRRLSATGLPTAIAAGLLAGIGAFLLAHADLRPAWFPGWGPPVVVALAGVTVPVFTDTLRGSVRVGFGGYLAGVGVLTLAWVGPFWLLPFAPGSRGLLLYSRLGRVITHALSSLLIPFFTGYLTAALVAGYLDP